MITPVVFVGDSITEAWAASRTALFLKHGFVGRGIGGETTRQIAGRLRAEIAATGARGLHLMGGINDIAQNEGPVTLETIKANWSGMLDEARALGVATWVGSITPADRIVWNPGIAPAPAIAAVNAWLAEAALARGVGYLDYHTVLATPSGALRDEYGTDGVHLSVAGYRAIEPVMLAALRPAPQG